ncbi:hypothetical protein ABIF13_005908 [Bradyrhizobium elkanii]
MSEVSAIRSTGTSAGLTFRKIGGDGMVFGNCPAAALIAAWTSCAAASVVRFSANCRVIAVLPKPLDEVMAVRPAICPNWRSNGVATDEPMVCGSAPGNCAVTWIVGVSTDGRAETGNRTKATKPISVMPIARKAVATGLRMKPWEMLMAAYLRLRWWRSGPRPCDCRVRLRPMSRASAGTDRR